MAYINPKVGLLSRFSKVVYIELYSVAFSADSKATSCNKQSCTKNNKSKAIHQHIVVFYFGLFKSDGMNCQPAKPLTNTLMVANSHTMSNLKNFPLNKNV